MSTVNTPELLKGRFHVHLTIECDMFNHKVHSWKTTVIRLHSQRKTQTDVMLTKHYHMPSIKTNCLQDIKADITKAVAEVTGMGYKITRIKLEHEDLPTLPPSQENYRECHIKLKLSKDSSFAKLQTFGGFVKSNNPLQSNEDFDIFFLNKRYYSGTIEEIEKDVKEVSDVLKAGSLIGGNGILDVLEVKIESVVYDTNKMLDLWWSK